MQNASKDKELPGRCQKHAASRPGGHDFQQRNVSTGQGTHNQNEYIPKQVFAAGWNARREPFPRPALRLTKTHTNQRIARTQGKKGSAFLVLTEKVLFLPRSFL